MLLNFGFLFVATFIVQFNNCLNLKAEQCVQEKPYLCTFGNSWKIDLSKLKTPNSTFLMASNSTNVYFYQPLIDLPISNLTEKAGIWYFTLAGNASSSDPPLDGSQVLAGKVKGTFTPIASIDTATFVDTMLYANIAKIDYLKSTVGKSRVNLVCDSNDGPDKLTIDDASKSPGFTHVMTLTAKAACPFGETTMSGGSVFIIIVLSLALLYFAGGMLALKFLRGAEGMEMIPNIEFWKGLPSLVQDGFIFAVSCGQRRPNSYERL